MLWSLEIQRVGTMLRMKCADELSAGYKPDGWSSRSDWVVTSHHRQLRFRYVDNMQNSA